jgi:hypothetical protein
MILIFKEKIRIGYFCVTQRSPNFSPTGVLPFSSCFKSFESQSVSQHRYGTQAHGGSGEYGVEERTAEKVQQACGNGNSQHVVAKRPEQILFYVANCPLA